MTTPSPQKGPIRVNAITVTLRNVTFDGDPADILVEHSDQSSDRLPSGSTLASGDTVVAEADYSFGVEFNPGGGAALSTVAAEGDPASITIPDPSFFDLIEDYYDGNGETTTTFEIGEDNISIRG